MNKTQSNHYRMFLNTQEYLDEKTNVWNVIPRVVTYKNNFDELLARIAETSKLTTDSVGVTERKGQLKRAIAKKVAMLSGVMQAYAYDIDDMDLAPKTSLSETEVYRLKDTELQGTVSGFLKLVEQHIGKLADFGLTPETLTELSTTVDEFNTLIGKPRVIMNSKYVALSTLDELFDETNSLIKNKLDKMMLMFKYTSNGFYEGYERARVIVD